MQLTKYRQGNVPILAQKLERWEIYTYTTTYKYNNNNKKLKNT